MSFWNALLLRVNSTLVGRLATSFYGSVMSGHGTEEMVDWTLQVVGLLGQC